jgi:energy-coupling factor transport system permease protein
MIERVQAVSWWALAFSLIFVASNSEIFGISFVIVAAVGLTLAGRRNNSDSSGFYFRFALIVMATRVLFRIIFSYPSGQIELLSLPNLSLNLGPLGNVRFLGNLTLETLFAAVSDGARLAAIILAVGMANSIADVRDVIRSLPNALREIGLSISIALNLAPQLVISIRRVRQAQLLRGRSQSLKALAGFAVPVLEDAIDRSIMLAASMDSRGFGRSFTPPSETGM